MVPGDDLGRGSDRDISLQRCLLRSLTLLHKNAVLFPHSHLVYQIVVDLCDVERQLSVAPAAMVVICFHFWGGALQHRVVTIMCAEQLYTHINHQIVCFYMA